MQLVWNTFLKGLATVLPTALTLYLIYWLGYSIEWFLPPAIIYIVPERYYLPGMGLLAGLGLVLLIGITVNAWVVRRTFSLGEHLLERIPVIKTIYKALHDFMDFFSTMQQHKDLKQVVLVTFDDIRLLGFLTSDNVIDLPGAPLSEGVVAVYLPMSYQIGGYTVYLSTSRVKSVNMSIEEAMRRIFMAGLSRSHDNENNAVGR